MNASIYRARRQALALRLRQKGGGAAILPAARELVRNADNTFPFRQESNFFYLSGFPEPDALLVVFAEDARTLLFCRDKDPQRETWDGFRFGPAAALEAFGVDAAFPIEALDSELPRLLADQPGVFYAHGASADFEARLEGWLGQVRQLARQGISAPTAFFDVRPILAEMRLLKDPSEVATLRRAAEITVAAHWRALRATRPGRHEYEIEAEIIAEFRRQGAQSPAYGSIVAGGANACVLHYLQNNRPLVAGDLLLIDAGCEFDGYAADVTQTFPISGRFSAEQRELYELVLEAQQAALRAVGPGRSWNDPHEAATRVLAQGMLDLKLLSGTLEEVLVSGSYRRHFMHRTGHWLGMDVHDVGEYHEPCASGGAQAKAWRSLLPGMVLTVEPGIYIRPSDEVNARFWNQGVRIEDDVLVTDEGCEVLSAGLPRRVPDIEAVARDL